MTATRTTTTTTTTPFITTLYLILFLIAATKTTVIDAFNLVTTSTRGCISTTLAQHRHGRPFQPTTILQMSDDPNPPSFSSTSTNNAAMMMIIDPMSESLVDIETMKQLEKVRRSQELREQEVFMKKSTGKHKCSNCDWEYDIMKGDSMMIGGQIKPDTSFTDLPSNWRCPVCRASKDSFVEIVEEIPGFEVNQGYGFGTNSWTAGQKNLAIFGGLGLFFVLFLSGYAMS